MSYLGYYQRGDEVFIPIITSSEQGKKLAPDNAPLVLIFNSSGFLEKQLTAPKIGNASDIFHFGAEYFLKSATSSGKYTVIIAYDKNPFFYIYPMYFDVYDSGDVHGNPVSMIAVKFENASYVVSQLSSGSIIRGRLNEKY